MTCCPLDTLFLTHFGVFCSGLLLGFYWGRVTK